MTEKTIRLTRLKLPLAHFTAIRPTVRKCRTWHPHVLRKEPSPTACNPLPPVRLDRQFTQATITIPAQGLGVAAYGFRGHTNPAVLTTVLLMQRVTRQRSRARL